MLGYFGPPPSSPPRGHPPTGPKNLTGVLVSGSESKYLPWFQAKHGNPCSGGMPVKSTGSVERSCQFGAGICPSAVAVGGW